MFQKGAVLNPFPAKGFPINEQNRLALDRVKSISALSADSAVKGLIGTFLTLLTNGVIRQAKSMEHTFFI